MKRNKPLSKSNQQKMNSALSAFYKPLDSKEPNIHYQQELKEVTASKNINQESIEGINWKNIL